MRWKMADYRSLQSCQDRSLLPSCAENSYHKKSSLLAHRYWALQYGRKLIISGLIDQLIIVFPCWFIDDNDYLSLLLRGQCEIKVLRGWVMLEINAWLPRRHQGNMGSWSASKRLKDEQSLRINAKSII